MTRRLLATSAALAAILLASACGGDDPLADDGGSSSEDKGTLVLGGQDFTEMQIMASMYQLMLEEAGYTVDAELVGTRDVYIKDLQDGNIDLVPEYAGSITDELQARVNGADAPQVSSSDVDETISALNELLQPMGLVALAPAEATDQNAFAVTEAFAADNNLTTLSDLGALGEPITLAAAEDCAKRPDCAIGLEKVYGIEIEEVLPLGFGTQQTKDSVIEGESQLGLVGTSDGSLEQLGLVILEDDKALQVSQNLVPVVSQETLDANPDIEETLNALSDVLTTEDLAAMNAAVDLERQKPDDVAQAYLEEQGLLG
ncbi:MAG: ABC transporter substrate-binding protein [Actinomycetota bacterium]|nr:ABC transporter substrate-binding protein [Actinomycetota bacterium]